MNRFLPLCAFVALFSSSGCIQDPASVPQEIPIPSAKGVYIINEGNFGRGNASLSYYELESFRIYNDVFSAVNGRNLGDVAAGMTIRGNSGYIVVNNSQKVEVIDVRTNRSTATIVTGPGSSPRTMAFVNDSLALLTDLYGNAVLQLNVSIGAVTGSIAVGANPEGIAVAAEKAFVANSGFGSGRTLTVISLASMTVTRTLRVADNPVGVQVTPGGMLYVVCAGSYGDFADPNDDTPARILVIDPVSEAIVDSIFIGGHAMNIAIGNDGIGYVAGAAEVFRVDTRIHRVTGAFVPGSYYGVGVERVSGDVYLSDPKTYIQPGAVLIYAPNGQLRTQIEPGLIPGSFAFKR